MDLCANAKLREDVNTNFELSLSKGNVVLPYCFRILVFDYLRTLTVKSWTDAAEEAAAAMLNSAKPPATGRSTSGETAAAAARGKRGQQDWGRAKGLARRGWRP